MQVRIADNASSIPTPNFQLLTISLPKASFCGAGGGTELVGVIMANQSTRVRRTVVGDGSRTIGGDNSDIEVYEALAGDCPRLGAHSVGSVAHRAGEAIQCFGIGAVCCRSPASERTS